LSRFGGSSCAKRPKTEANKALAIRFYNALAQGDIATLQRSGRPDYIQHNPAFETGLAGLINASTSARRAAGVSADPTLEFVRTAAEGEFVWLLRKMPHRRRARNAPTSTSSACGRKVAEHWDYQETFPRGRAPKTTTALLTTAATKREKDREGRSSSGATRGSSRPVRRLGREQVTGCGGPAHGKNFIIRTRYRHDI